MTQHPSSDERLRRWRLILGGDQADGTGLALAGLDLALDRALGALYDANGGGDRRGSLGASAPNVARWLGDIREYFPSSVVRIMQRDALERLNLRQLLLEPELLEAVEPDVRLVATLVSLRSVLPGKARETARLVVRRVVDELERRLASPLRQAVGAASTGLAEPAGPATPRSTGRAPYAPTSSITSLSTERSSRRLGSASAASARRCATSSCASTRAARWLARSSTLASSERSWPRCRPSAPGSSSSTPAWST